jgi:hypothetical protein
MANSIIRATICKLCRGLLQKARKDYYCRGCRRDYMARYRMRKAA